MNKVFKNLIVVSLVLVMILGVNGIALANGNLGDDIMETLQNGDGLIDDGIMNNIKGASKDIYDIVRYVVLAGLAIIFLYLLFKIPEAADQPALKKSLRAKLLATTLAIILAINFWKIYAFLSKIELNF